VFSASYFAEGCDDMHALAHDGSVHAERQLMSAVQSASASQADISVLQ